MKRKKPELHGMTGTRPHNIWRAMKQRCLNPSSSNYHKYGGRGITICDRWLEFGRFWEDMKDSYFDGGSIDRIDGEGNYEPDNCRWATPKEQARNMRSNRFVLVDGISMTVAEAAERKGIRPGLIHGRLEDGWPVDEVAIPPIVRA